MSFFKKKIKVCTHNGTFHADDVFAVAVLDIFFQKKHNQKIEIIRTRDESVMNNSDIVLDVGGIYDAEKNRFDHHQTGGAGFRESKIPYAAFGLIWKHYGNQLCAQDVWQKIDEKFVSQVDACDTGYEDFFIESLQGPSIVPNYLVSLFRPSLSESNSDQDYLNQFKKCVTAAKEILNRLILQTHDTLESRKKVLDIYENTDDKRIIILDEFLSWKTILTDKPEPLFVLYPDVDGIKYRIQSVPIEKGKYEVRKSLPKSWWGLRDADLEKETGIKGVIFCHNVGFTGAGETLESVQQMAEKALLE